MNIDPAILLGLRPQMMSVAYRMLGSVTDAEDAVQDAFVRIQAAEVLGTSEVHVRQIVSRARHRLEQDMPRFHPAPHEADGLAERFLAACRAGDVRSIEEMLTEDVEVLSDGGGKVSAARTVITG